MCKPSMRAREVGNSLATLPVSDAKGSFPLVEGPTDRGGSVGFRHSSRSKWPLRRTVRLKKGAPKVRPDDRFEAVE